MKEGENQIEKLIENERKKNSVLEWKPEYNEEQEKKFRKRVTEKLPKLDIDKKLVEIGDRIEVFWGEEFAKGREGFYKGEVVGKEGDEYEILYDDEKEKGKFEPILEDLKNEEWRIE